MRLVIQRVTKANVVVDNNEIAAINNGLLVLVGIGNDDNEEDILWLTKKLSQLRIFSDSDGKMNLSIQEVSGEFLVISQFTLHAATKKGTRPSYIKAARPDIAIPLYQQFIDQLRFFSGLNVQTGEFGADMKVGLLNDGPVTICLDSKNKE